MNDDEVIFILVMLQNSNSDILMTNKYNEIDDGDYMESVINKTEQKLF